MSEVKSYRMINLVSLTVLVLSALLFAASCMSLFPTPHVEEQLTCASDVVNETPPFLYVISLSVITSLLLVSLAVRVKAATLGNTFTVWTSTMSTVLMLINTVFCIVGIWIRFA
ncbi:hypothetical protein [Xanthomonas medicagonis]|uniref:hypothetical protein n=1 Tax=Xanthomonas medicagonis TaxID=3160841 RepID=UPI0035136F15